MPNDDLISRKALLERFEELKDNANNRLIDIVFLDGAMSVIDAAPAVDAEPVRHGRWLEDGSIGAIGNYCSLCDKRVKPDANYNYCPNCGAKMDKEKKHEHWKDREAVRKIGLVIYHG